MNRKTARLVHVTISVWVWTFLLILAMPWIVADRVPVWEILATYPFVIALALFISSQKDKDELQAEVMARWRAQGLID